MKEHFNLFDTTDQVVVYNPTEEDFKFVVGGEREYEVLAKQMKLLHGSAARLYVKKMCDAYHIRENRVSDLNNKNAEAETANLFVKKVISDDMPLDEKALADLIKTVKPTDTPEVKEEVTKETSQAERVVGAEKMDSAPIKETAFPTLKQK